MYLKKFGIENFRIFKDPVEFEFRPITILVGENNSGKSTLLKALGFLHKNANEKSIERIFPSKLNLNFPRLGITAPEHFFPDGSMDSIFRVHLSLEGTPNWGFFMFHEVLLSFTLNLEYPFPKGVDSFFLQHFSFTSVTDNNEKLSLCTNDKDEDFLRRKIWIKIEDTIIINWINELKNRALELDWAYNLYFGDYFSNFEHGWVTSIPISEEKIKNAFLTKGISREELHRLCCMMFSINYIGENYLNLQKFPFSEKVEGFINVLEDFLSKGSKFKFDHAFYVMGTPLRTNDPLNDFFRDGLYDYFQTLRLFFSYEFKHLSNNRSTPKRYYSPEDIDDVYLNISRKLLPSDKERIVEILKNILGVADDFEIQDIEGYLKKLMIIKNGKRTNVVDMGYGITQLLPIILKPDEEKNNLYAYPKSWLISEPETGLHPSLQSKLADLFAHLHSKSSSRFVIETHSEYIIRKLQYLIRQTSCPLSKEDVQIYYFYHPDELPPGENQIKSINIDEDGNLTDNFGPGFYDESSRISLELWNLNTSQKN